MARKSKYKEEVEDLNLVPIMNLVLCLIPAVLFQTQLIKIGIIDVNPPQIASAPSSTPPDPDKKPLGLTLTIAPTKLIISAADGQLSNVFPDKTEVEVGMDSNVTPEPGTRNYDYVQLYKKMQQIRAFFSGEKYEKELLKIKANEGTDFKYIIRVMDIVRYEIKAEISVTNIDELSQAITNQKFVNIGDDKVKEHKPLWAYITFDAAVKNNEAQGAK
jgi:biopolymer transport protein ExbD